MKQHTTTTQQQQLSLTPQLRQSLHLLQLSAAELEQEVADALEANPLLDWVEPPTIAVAEPADDTRGEYPDTSPLDAPTPEAPQVELLDAGWETGPEPWEDTGTGGGGEASGEEEGGDWTERTAQEDGLHAHLAWQLTMGGASAREHGIGMALIDAIDDDGYLRETLEAIADTLRPDIDATPFEIEAVLHHLQQFDPVGVGARDLAECLRLQLCVLPPDPVRDLALRLCGEALERLPKLGVEGVARLLGTDTACTERSIALIRSLSPRPGSAIAPLAHDTYVLPDAVIWREHGLWKVALSSRSRPRIGVNAVYVRMIQQASSTDAEYMRTRLQEARWLLKGIRARGDTLLAVLRCLVRDQAGFLEFGEQALRPLSQREVAEELGLHESTISRAVARKHVHTPRGMLPVRTFFSNEIGSAHEAGTSSTAVQSMLRALVEAEDPRKPLSDAALAARLQENGAGVARRTVAKYREQLGIAPSHERVRLG